LGKFQVTLKIANSFLGKENPGKENEEPSKPIFFSWIFFSEKTVN